MVAAVTVRVSKANAVAVVDSSGGDIRVAQAGGVAVMSIPADEMRISQAGSIAVTTSDNDIRVAKAMAVAVLARRADNPYALVWTATLDAHEYLFIQLYNETLVHDFHAGRWYVWGSEDARLWRAQMGLNWVANISGIQNSLSSEPTKLSKILVGDHQYGALYFLDPEMAEDDDYEGSSGLAFQRLIYGQLAVSGYTYVSVPAVQLRGSIGETVGASDMTVTLYYSDDRGHTFTQHDSLAITEGEYDTRVEWRSLGSFRGQGRLFKIEDYGALTRIDGLDMPDG